MLAGRVSIEVAVLCDTNPTPWGRLQWSGSKANEKTTRRNPTEQKANLERKACIRVEDGIIGEESTHVTSRSSLDAILSHIMIYGFRITIQGMLLAAKTRPRQSHQAIGS